MTDAALPAAPLRGGSGFITGLGVAQICSWGSLYYSFPLIAAAMERDLGWSKPDLYLGATVGLLLSAALTLPVGAAIDRGHGRWLMATASVAAGLLLVGWAFVASLPWFYVVAAALGALQAATLYEPAFAVVARRSGPMHSRNGITALTLWGGFASTAFVPLIQLLIDYLGWRGTLGVLGAINVLVCGTIYWLVIDPSRDAPKLAAEKPTGQPPLSLALANPVFWGLAAAFSAYSVTFSAFIFHFYPMMLERGLTANDVVVAMVLIGPAQVAGRVAVRLFASDVSGRSIGTVVVAVFPVALGILYFAPAQLWTVGLVAVLYGGANGIMTIVRGVAVPEMVSREGYGAINGAMTAPMVIAKAGAPLAAAWLWAATGGYWTVLASLIATSVVTVGAFWYAAATAGRKPSTTPRSTTTAPRRAA